MFFRLLQISFPRYYTKIICVVISKIYFLVVLHRFRTMQTIAIVYHARLLPANLRGGFTLRNLTAFSGLISGQSLSNMIGIFLACSNSFSSSSVIPQANMSCKIHFLLPFKIVFSLKHPLPVSASKHSSALAVLSVYQNISHPAESSPSDYIPQTCSPQLVHPSGWNNSSQHSQKNNDSILLL